MDTILKHSKKLLQPYARKDGADEIIASAQHLARLILSDDTLLQRHKKKILSDVLWLISEVDGKYSPRYRSKRVVELATSHPTSEEKIQHEHVFPRKHVVEYLLKNPEELQTVLAKTTACIVTTNEHKSLIKLAEGWGRYKNVTVMDMLPQPPIEHIYQEE